MIFEITQLV